MVQLYYFRYLLGNNFKMGQQYETVTNNQRPSEHINGNAAYLTQIASSFFKYCALIGAERPATNCSY